MTRWDSKMKKALTSLGWSCWPQKTAELNCVQDVFPTSKAASMVLCCHFGDPNISLDPTEQQNKISTVSEWMSSESTSSIRMKQEVSRWSKKRQAVSTGLGPMLHLTHLVKAHDCLRQTSAAAVSYITKTRIMTPLSPLSLYRWKPEAPASVARTPASTSSVSMKWWKWWKWCGMDINMYECISNCCDYVLLMLSMIVVIIVDCYSYNCYLQFATYIIYTVIIISLSFWLNRLPIVLSKHCWRFHARQRMPALSSVDTHDTFCTLLLRTSESLALTS